MAIDVSKYSAIPAEACRMATAGVEYGTNGDGAKTIPVKLMARSAAPIEHPFWGKVVHDFAGMSHKSRLAIDYCHDSGSMLGYVNHFDVKPDGLYLSGALIPYKDSDLAHEIAYKQAQGVPYEASIDFTDAMKLQILEDNEVSQCNGMDVTGPAIIVRKWSLRGVAICPQGADPNTETSFKNTTHTVVGHIITQKDVTAMTNPETKTEAVEAEAKVMTAVDAAPAQAVAEAVKTDAVDAEATKMVKAEVSAEQFAQVNADLAAAMAEIAQLKAQISQVQITAAGTAPVQFSEAPVTVKNKPTWESIIRTAQSK